MISGEYLEFHQMNNILEKGTMGYYMIGLAESALAFSNAVFCAFEKGQYVLLREDPGGGDCCLSPNAMMSRGCLQVQHFHSEYTSVILNNMAPHGKCILGSKLGLLGIDVTDVDNIGCKAELLSRQVLVMVPEEQ